MTTLQEMRDYVRLYLDLDEEDLPDLIFDRFAEDGAQKIVERDPNWPWLETSVDFVPVVGQSAYATATVAPTIGVITGVAPVDQSLYHEYQWTAWADIDDWGSASVPMAWTEYGANLYIVPAPLTTDQIRVSGLLRVEDWTAAGPSATPPLPAEFHSLILEWTLAMTYAQQDDPENSAMHQGLFAERLESVWRRWASSPHAADLKIGSAPRRRTVGGPVWPANF